jgi:hypothetical protein
MSTSYKPNLKEMTIMYDSPLQQGFELLFVRGDASLILQRYPGRPMATMTSRHVREKSTKTKSKNWPA